MFLTIDPYRMRFSRQSQAVRISCTRMSGRGEYRVLVVRIPLGMLAAAGIRGPRVDVAVGAIGTPDEGLMRIAAGETFALLSDRKGNYQSHAAYVRMSLSPGLPLVPATEVKVREQQGAIIIVMPHQLRPHYEDLARKAARIAENRVALKEVKHG
jgi:hypothetical protein